MLKGFFDNKCKLETFNYTRALFQIQKRNMPSNIFPQKEWKVNFKSTGLFLRKHNRSICELLQEQASLWGNDKYLCVHAMHHCCTPPPSFLLGAGGGAVDPPAKFSKKGFDRISIFRVGLLGKRGDLFSGGCSIYIKNNMKNLKY